MNRCKKICSTKTKVSGRYRTRPVMLKKSVVKQSVHLDPSPHRILLWVTSLVVVVVTLDYIANIRNICWYPFKKNEPADNF